MHRHGSDIATPPRGRTLLVGRDEEVDHVTQLVHRPDVRLVTVTGRSGVGKSLLAATVAERIEIDDGVGIPRAQVDRHTNGSGTGELRAALFVSADGPAGPSPAGRRRVVLVDGLEAVSGSSALVAQALAADEGLTVLATSIVPLALPGEQLVRLEPLPVPGPGESSIEAQCAAPAVQLLQQRIREAAGSDDEPDLAAVVTLARVLDGLPLSLELAAARCAELPVTDVLARIERLGALEALGSTAHAADETHRRNLRSTIRWSYDLLDDEHQLALRRLGVFAGSFGRSAAAAVTEVDPDRVDRLVVAGLARATGSDPAGVRFELVPSVSLLARELLAAEGDLLDTEDRHAEHFLAVAAAARPMLHSAATPEVRRRLLADLEDLVTAVRHLDRRGRREDAIRVLVDLALVWEESSASARAAPVLDELLPVSADERVLGPDTAAEAWALAATVAVWGQRSARPRDDLLDRLSRSLDLARGSGSTRSVLMVLRAQVATFLADGRTSWAVAAGEEGLTLARDLGDPWWTCQFLGWCAASHTMDGDPVTARDRAVLGRDLALLEGDTVQLLRLSHLLAGIAGAGVDVDDAPMDVHGLVGLARRVDDPHAEGVLHIASAVTAVAGGDAAAAARDLLSALDLGRRRGLWYLEELMLLATVVVAVAGGRPEDSARLHGSLTEVLPGIERAIAPESMQLYRFAVEQARGALGDDEFDRTVAGGRLLDWEDATALGAAVCDALSGGVASAADEPDDSSDSGDGPLSPRQAEVVALVALGRTNKEIATELGMRPKTVMHHTSEIYRRLGVRNRTEAVAEARRLGILDRSA